MMSEPLYGRLSAEKYLTGQFQPEQEAQFTSLEKLGIPTRGRKLYLRKEAATALKQLVQDFREAHPKTPFWVQSATRNFYAQKSIWEGKWTGRRLVDGQKLNRTHPDPVQRALKILEYSSMPGTSRHHWGTDFDLNHLTNDYYESGADAVLFQWLRKNAGKYGFCQPYTAGRSAGYFEERWHWSYRPLAARFLADWKEIFAHDDEKFSKSGSFAGAKEAGKLAPLYVESVDNACEGDLQ